MSTGWALFAAGLLFALFLIVKSRWPARLRGDGEGYRKLASIKQRAAEATDPVERARAYREAAHVALEDLGRPNLAATYARRAERADPDSAESVGTLTLALRRAARYRALERQLWRKLAADHAGAAQDRAFDELLRLYEGPLRRPEQATVLRRLRERSS